MVGFGDYELDDAAHELRVRGEPVHLEPQAFAVLVHLVRHRARVVPKQELLDEVWGHRFVSESALTTRIKEIRRAVGDDGSRQAVVANVRGRGYRFVAVVDESPAGARAVEPGPATVGGPTHLIGREPDVVGVTDRLSTSRLVTVVGPGGVGKTTLATEVARLWRAAADRPVRTISLGEVTEPGSVVAALAEATGVMADGADPARVVDALRSRTDLLVLDNCEHVLDAVAPLVADVLDSAPRVTVLATSRERLGLSPELVWPLLPLTTDQSHQLFLARADAARPGVAVPGAVVDRVVEALDGLPLAIEMAAAQLSTIGAEELVALVEERIDLLQSPNRAAPARHRTLDALVRWSLDLLQPGDRALIQDLTVFSGATSAADAAGVLRGGADPGAALAMGVELSRLCDRSLLVADATTAPSRYRMPEVVRTVVSSELAGAGPRQADLHARHARAQLEAAVTADGLLRGADERAGHDRLTVLIPELRAAHRWAREHDPALVTDLGAALQLFAYSRLWGEPAAWARIGGEPVDPVQAAVAAADAANRSRLREATELAQAARGSDDPRAQALGLEVLSDVAVYLGELDSAASHAGELHRLDEATGDLHLQVVGLVNLALSAAYAGEVDQASATVARMELLLGELAPSDRAWCRYVAGELASGVDPAAAEAPLQEAVTEAEAVGNRLVPCVARTTLATVLVRLGEVDDALDAYATAIGEAIDYGNSTHAATMLRNLVALLVDLGDGRSATVLLGALGGDDVKVTYGEEARRVGSARDALGRTGSSAQLDGWLAEGAALGLEGALRVALRAVSAQRA